MDLQEDIRQHVLNTLPYDQNDHSELFAKSASELLIIYKNWLQRLVNPRPRNVQCSPALLSNPHATSPEFKPGFDQIIAYLKAGTDLTPHLSRAIMHGFEGQGTGSRRSVRQDLDLILSDWGIYHFHLNTTLESDGFVKRSGPLLFAAIKPQDAYLIDILVHGSWTREHLIETIVKEWPNAGLVHELKGAMGLAHTIAEEDRKTLRKKHVNALFEFDGKVYMPAGGMMASGVSIKTVMAADQLLQTVNWFETEVNQNPNYVAEIFSEAGLSKPSETDLHFEFFDNGGYGVIERITGFRIRLAN